MERGNLRCDTAISEMGVMPTGRESETSEWLKP
jgi:hypothetical protein